MEEALRDVETLVKYVIKNSISELESHVDEAATSIENRFADMKKQGDDDYDKVTTAWQKIREFKGITKKAKKITKKIWEKYLLLQCPSVVLSPQ